MEYTSLTLAITLGLAVLYLLFKPIFGDKETFIDCIKFWIKPNFLSWLNGEGFDDWISEMKLTLWLGLGVGTGIIVHHLLMSQVAA